MQRQVLSVLVTRGLGAGMQAVVLVLLARGLGAAIFGQYALLVAIGGFVTVALGFGTSSLALRVRSLEVPERAASGILSIRTLIMTPALLLMAVLLTVAGLPLWVVAAAVSSVFLESTSLLQESLLFGFGRRRAAQSLMVVRRTLVFLGVGGAWVLRLPLLEVFATLNIVASLGLFVFVRAKAWVPSAVIPTLREARKFWFPAMLAKLESLDVVTASIGLSSQQLGGFAAASRIGAPLNLLPGSLLSIYTPKLAETKVEGERRVLVRGALRMLLLALAPVMLVSPLIGIAAGALLGDGFSGVEMLLVVFLLSIVCSAFSQCLISYFYACGDPGPVRNARLVGVPVGLVAVLGLSFFAGALGAAFGTVLMHGLILGLLGIAYRRRPAR